MMTVTIKIENNNLDKAKTEVEALLVYIDTLAKTYPTNFEKPVAEKPVAEKPVAEKPVAEKPVRKKKEEPVTEEVTTDITLEALTAKAREIAKTKREEVKELIASFGAGKLSSVPEDKYEELNEALEKLC